MSFSLIIVLTSCINSKDKDSVSNTKSKSEEFFITSIEYDTIVEATTDISGESETAAFTIALEGIEVYEPNSEEQVNSAQTEKETNMPYPVFTNIENEKQVNQLILDYISQIETLYNADDSLTLCVDYQIMFQNDQYISIYFTGDIKGAAYPRLFKSTLNIDLIQVSQVTLNQIVHINDDFINIFSDAAQIRFESFGGNMTDVISMDSIKESLEQADTIFNSDVQSYFTSDEVVIIWEVPHVLGDYIEVGIPLTSIENHLF